MIKYIASQPQSRVIPTQIKHDHGDYLELLDGGIAFIQGYYNTWQEAKDFLVTQSRNRLASLREDLMREQAKLSKLQAMQPPEDNDA